MTLFEFIDTWRLGDIASLLGLVLAIVGFAITITAALRATKAAKAAQHDVNRAREELRTFYSATKLAIVISRLIALKKAHRRREWGGLPDQYAELRHDLIVIRHRLPNMNDTDASVLQAGISMLKALENDVEKHLEADTEPSKIASMNRRVADQLDEMQRVLAALEPNHGQE